MMPNRTDRIIHLAEQVLARSGRRLFSPADLARILQEVRLNPGFSKSPGLKGFVDLLLQTKTLQKVHLTSTYPLRTTRYAYAPFTELELAVSLRPNSYLSHATAAFLHSLSETESQFVYVNQEQSAKSHLGPLTQAALNRAFATSQRQSAFIVTHEQTKIMFLSGKDTRQLGVQEITGKQGELIRVTDIDRTFIDLAVRPSYSGGIHNVLRIYTGATAKTTAERLAEMLKGLAYLYPYHQAIGFLLARAGYAPESLTPLAKLGCHFDFFLSHGMTKTKFDSQWRVHYPAEL
jgi:hypothetical protein